MTRYLDISSRDAIWYFDQTICVDKETGKKSLVSVRDRGDGTYRYSIGTTYMEPEEFFSKFDVYKFPLGWVNINRIAVFLSANARRSTKKGYTLDEIAICNPYFMFLHGLRRSLLNRVMNDRNSDGDVNRKSPTYKRLQRIDALLASRSVHVSSSRTITGGNTTFVSVPASIATIIESTRYGARALSNNFAICACVGTRPGGIAALWYRSKYVGTVSAEGVELFAPFDYLKDQFYRETNTEARVKC